MSKRMIWSQIREGGYALERNSKGDVSKWKEDTPKELIKAWENIRKLEKSGCIVE